MTPVWDTDAESAAALRLMPKLACRGSALFQRVTPYDLVAFIHFGYLAALCGSFQDRRSFPKRWIASAINRPTILMNLKKHDRSRFLWPRAS